MSRLVALKDGAEKADMPLNGEFHNIQAINLDHVTCISPFDTNCFLRSMHELRALFPDGMDKRIEYRARFPDGIERQVNICGLHFTLVGNVHRKWVFLEEQRSFRDSLFRDLMNNSYGPK